MPGSGKTLVGLSAVHNPALDNLAVGRAGGKPPAPAIFLSGNGPLVEVLHYELRDAGGGGKTFVRDVRNYVKQYLGDKAAVPPQHVIVYDEAQRAWDVEQVAAKHAFSAPMSGPDDNGRPLPCRLEGCAQLDLQVELRFHFCSDLDAWVDGLLADDRGWPDEVSGREAGAIAAHCRELSERLETQAYHLRMTRDLETARAYLRDRYADAPDARFGLVASSRDKALPDWGVFNDRHSTRRVQLGPWYGDGDRDSHHSCRHLHDCVTEFGAQGLELDGVLLAWAPTLCGRPIAGRTPGRSTTRARRTCAIPSNCASTPTACY